MRKRDTRFRWAIPVPKCVSEVLSWLVNGGSQGHAGSSFGVFQPTTQVIIDELIKVFMLDVKIL